MRMSNPKEKIRSEILAQRALLALDEKAHIDSKFNDFLIEFITRKKISVLHIYLPMIGEIDFWPTIEYALNQGITVVCPEALKEGNIRNRELLARDKIKKGIFGTFFPDNMSTYDGFLDLIIVPGLAFNKKGGRIGYGGGYYDRFLAGREKRAMAFCYGFQIFEDLPLEAHDIRIEMVVSYDMKSNGLKKYSSEN